MGYSKHLLRQAGHSSYEDFEVQSTIHDYGHRFNDMPDPSEEEYVAFLKGFRQQVLTDRTLSEADKFRPATGRGGQPGLITRIDQELERCRTGKDENGRLLRPEQINAGRHFAAMARLAGPVGRQQAAKEGYFEVYARHTGVSVDEARKRFTALTHDPRAIRDDTKISLTDGWQDRLAIAGFTSAQQADLGQSNQTRYALKVMETERASTIAALPSRPALRAEHRHQVLSPDDPAVRDKIQCVGGCGQFGHTPDACPNQAQLDRLNTARATYTAARDGYDQVNSAAQAREALAQLADGQPVSNITSDGARVRPDIDTDLIEPGNTEAIAALTAAGEPYSQRKYRAAVKAAREAKAELADAEAAFEQARGEVPPVSSFVQEVAYNPDSNVFAVVTRPYTLKRTGEVRPAKKYMFRMGQDQFDELMSSPDFSERIARSVFARGGVNEAYKFENEADLAEASIERRCPSCGQYATMTSSHQCPVDGSGTEQENFQHQETLRQAREVARIRGLPVPMAAQTPRATVRTLGRTRLPRGGVMTFPGPREVGQLLNRRSVAIGPFTSNFLGAQVTGRVHVWNEPGTNVTLYQVDQVKCSCGARPPCRHTESAAVMMGRPYRATLTNGAPGSRNFERPLSAAANHFEPVPRLSYERIQKLAADERIAYQRQWVGNPARRTFTTEPLNAHTRQPMPPEQVPGTWTSPSGATVNLDDTAAVSDGIRQHFAGHGERTVPWRVTTDGVGGIWVRSASPDRAAGQHLRAAFGLPAAPGARGIYIPPERAWRHQMLSQMAGQRPTILGSRFAEPAPAK